MRYSSRDARDAGSAGRRLLIVLGILIVLLVAADRGGNWIAERAAADTIQSAQHLPKRPSVDITGFPFLTQLASGNFNKIIITDQDVPVGKGAVRLRVSNVQVALNNVHVARNFSSVHARTAHATATVSYADLGAALGGVNVTYLSHGRIQATKAITFAGHTFHASITATPQVSDGLLSFGKTEINNAGVLGQTVSSLLSQVFDVRLPLTGIPFHVHVRSLSADSSGLHIALTGEDLTYSR
jgi:hypothetical protein